MYGVLPKVVGSNFKPNPPTGEYLYYQDMPIKLSGQNYYKIEQRIHPFSDILNTIISDFIKNFGIDRHIESNIYLTLKRQYQKPSCGFNRHGWHSDNFMSNDISYIWSDSQPTIFNTSKFNLSQDHKISLQEMNEQALWYNNYTFPDYSILRLDQYSIHKVGEIKEGVRTFMKVTFSDKKFDLEGNTHNYLLNYAWSMRPRNKVRNVPHN